MDGIPVLGFAAYSGVGKTTVMEQVIAALRRRGLRVAAVKHDGHDFEIDRPCKDSWRFDQAGAEATILASDTRTVVMERRGRELTGLFALAGDVDIILVEGYKAGGLSQIGICRRGTGKGLPLEAERYAAVVTDGEGAWPVPRFGFDQIEELTDFIMEHAEDFTHFNAMTAEEIGAVSRIVNEAILSGYEVRTDVLPIEEAKQRGAIALFGEKYGDTVRVVDMGDGYSVEFCGGTHLSNTAMAGPFRIKSEFSVASGVRRIEATTGKETLRHFDGIQQMAIQAAAVLKAKPGELREKAEAVMGEVKSLHQVVEKFKAKEAAGETERILFGAHDVGGLKVLTATVPEADGARLRQMGDLLREKDENVVAVLASVNDGKITFLCACGKGAVKRGIKAGDIIKQVCAIAGGSGGGKPDSAMGGGKDVLMLDNALAMVDNVVAMKLGL